jgi:hypothetical protein
MSQTAGCQTPPTHRLPADHLPNTKRSNERRLWHEQEAGSPVTPSRPCLEDGRGPKYGSKEDRYDVDKSVEPDKKKLRTPPSKSGSKNRGRRSAQRKIAFLENSESDTLRSELASVHKTYLSIIQDRDKEIETLKENMMTLSNLFAEDSDALHKENIEVQQYLNITEEELTISQKSVKVWTGISLKLKFILDEIRKIGALPEDHASWVDPMVEDIEIPEVSINIKDEFVPTAQTDNIDWVDEEEDEDEDEDEEDIIGDYLDNETTPIMSCSNCGEMNDHVTCDCPMPRDFLASHGLDEHGTMMNVIVPRMEWNATSMYNYRPHSRAILEKSASIIQKAWQNHQCMKKEQLDKELDEYMTDDPFAAWLRDWPPQQLYCATKIQSAWRGYWVRRSRHCSLITWSAAEIWSGGATCGSGKTCTMFGLHDLN